MIMKSEEKKHSNEEAYSKKDKPGARSDRRRLMNAEGTLDGTKCAEEGFRRDENGLESLGPGKKCIPGKNGR